VTSAIYFDGRSTRAHPVEVTVVQDFVHITGDSVRRIEVLRALRFTVAYAHAPSRVDLPDGASLEVSDAAGFLSLRMASGQAPSRVERLESSLRYAVVALFVILLAGVSAYIWGIPIAADLIVEHAPRSIDARVARGSLEQLQQLGWIGAEEPLTPREVTLSGRFAALADPIGVPYHLVFRTFKGGPNAFALPDGTILISKEIEGLSDNDDAVLFVMCHELGHLRYRHGMKSLARATMTSVIMMWYVGDVSSAVALATAGVANLSYSRSAESEADHFSSQLLHQHGLSTKPAAELFRQMEAYVPPKGEGLFPDWTKKLPGARKDEDKKPDAGGEDKKPDAGGEDKKADAGGDDNNAKGAGVEKQSRKPGQRPKIPTYLSTHPATADRIKMLEEDKD
jgi:Zn-dependent protease with chaperone function